MKNIENKELSNSISRDGLETILDIDERKDSFASPFIKRVELLKLKSSSNASTGVSGYVHFW